MGQIPALRDVDEGGQPVELWESAAILLYLAGEHTLLGATVMLARAHTAVMHLSELCRRRHLL
jgi:glutathione S-transferase